MNKRILLISSNSSSRGGGERYLVYLTQGLYQLGQEVHVLLSQKSYMDDWANLLRREGAIVHRLPLIGLRHRPLRFIQSINDKKQQQDIAYFCQTLKPLTILVNQQYDEDGLDYLMGAIKAQIAPVSGVVHMPMTADKNKRPLGILRGNLLQKWYDKNPYKIIFVSEGCQKEFHSYYHFPHATNVINLGCKIPDNALASNRISQPNMSKIPVIGFIGQFVPQKNLNFLIESWLWLDRKGIKTKLLLVGDGVERPQIEQKLRASTSLDNWKITGWQTNPEKYLNQIDIYAMSSHFEGLPLALIEAVGYGIPAVITDFNGSSDIARQASWVKVISSKKSEDFGQALQEAINCLSDLKQKSQAGKAKFCKYFSTERMAKDTLVALGIN